MKAYRYKVEMFNLIDRHTETFCVMAYSFQDAVDIVETILTDERWEDIKEWARKKVEKIS